MILFGVMDVDGRYVLPIYLMPRIIRNSDRKIPGGRIQHMSHKYLWDTGSRKLTAISFPTCPRIQGHNETICGIPHFVFGTTCCWPGF